MDAAMTTVTPAERAVSMPTVADDIRARLRKLNRSQAEAARRAGFSGAQLSRLLSGERKWSLLTARAFSFGNGIPLTVILPPGDGEKAA